FFLSRLLLWGVALFRRKEGHLVVVRRWCLIVARRKCLSIGRPSVGPRFVLLLHVMVERVVPRLECLARWYFGARVCYVFIFLLYWTLRGLSLIVIFLVLYCELVFVFGVMIFQTSTRATC